MGLGAVADMTADALSRRWSPRVFCCCLRWMGRGGSRGRGSSAVGKVGEIGMGVACSTGDAWGIALTVTRRFFDEGWAVGGASSSRRGSL